MTNALKIELQPKQVELYRLVEDSPATDIGYGGARGGGKSHGARAVILLRRLEHPGTRALIFRRTYGELFENHIERLFQEYPALRQYYSVSNKLLQLPPALGGGSIVFGHAENPGDIYDFQGKEYMDILVDEATKLSKAELDFLRTCRRWKGVDDRSCKMILTCNPGGVGHSYIKRVMIDRRFQENELPDAYAFIPAHGWDNVEWARKALEANHLTVDDYYGWTDDQRYQYFITRTQYGRDLNALPESLRIQHLMGRWDYFEGQVFPELNEADHNLDQWASPRELRLVSALDHATTGITAFVQLGVDKDERLMALEEYYRRDQLISEHAMSIKLMLARYGKQDYTLIDPSTEAKTMQNVREMYSVQDAYRREGLPTVVAQRASIGVGLDLIKEMLRVDPMRIHPFEQKRGSPRLFISKKLCPNGWREMTELQAQNEDGKVTYIGDDHWIDCVRYVAMSRPRAAAVKALDMKTLPTTERLMVKSFTQWAKQWDRLANPNRSGSWF